MNNGYGIRADPQSGFFKRRRKGMDDDCEFLPALLRKKFEILVLVEKWNCDTNIHKNIKKQKINKTRADFGQVAQSWPGLVLNIDSSLYFYPNSVRICNLVR